MRVLDVVWVYVQFAYRCVDVCASLSIDPSSHVHSFIPSHQRILLSLTIRLDIRVDAADVHSKLHGRSIRGLQVIFADEAMVGLFYSFFGL